MCDESDCATVPSLLHFAASAFFCKDIIVTSIKSTGHSPFSYMLFISCHLLETTFSQHSEYICRYIIIPCSLLIPHLFDCFFHFITTSNYFIRVGCTNSVHQIAMATKFWKVAPSICKALVWSLLNL